MTINESVEDYLEAILVLKEKNGMVRSIDVVHHMNYSKPSISRAMSRLRENGYITMDPEGWLGLTDAGSDEWVNSRDLIKRQAEYVDENTKAGGIALYNYSSFFSLSEQNTAEREALSGFLNSGAFSD